MKGNQIGGPAFLRACAARPLRCRHRTRISDRIIIEKLIQVLRFGCSYESIADRTRSATAVRDHRSERIRARKVRCVPSGRATSVSNNADMTPGLSRPDLVRVLESAARLQAVVPDAILVGGSAAALWASHRTSFDHDHDHVLADLNVRFDTVLAAIEATEGWVTNRVTPRQDHPRRAR